MLCPLCQKECATFGQKILDSPPIFACPTEVSDLLGSSPHSHFACRNDEWEMAIVPPFKVMTNFGETNRSTIYKNMGEIYMDIDDIPTSCYTPVLTLPPVHLDLEEKLLERIKLLLLLS